jgi:hypothetical protein
LAIGRKKEGRRFFGDAVFEAGLFWRWGFAGEVAKAKSPAIDPLSFRQQRVFSLSRSQVICHLCLGSSGSELSAAVAVALFGLALGVLNYSLYRS